jgi:hypothetical protein
MSIGDVGTMSSKEYTYGEYIVTIKEYAREIYKHFI